MANDADSEADGLIYAYALDAEGGGQPVEWGNITEAAKAVNPVWVHLNFTKASTRKWIRETVGVDATIAAALLDSDSRPRTLNHETGLLAILRGVNTNPGADPEDMVSIRIWIDANYIITTCRRNLLSVATLREKLLAGTGPTSQNNFLLMLIEELDDRIEPVVDQLDEAIEAAEFKFESGNMSSYRGEFSALRRQSARIRRFLAPQRDGLERLAREDLAQFKDADRFRLREEADRVTRQLETLDLVRERAMVAQEEVIAKLAQQQNERMYLLSIIAAIFLPLSFLTGLLGMNVAGLPGLEYQPAFSISVGLMVLVGVLIVVVFKLAKWL